MNDSTYGSIPVLNKDKLRGTLAKAVNDHWSELTLISLREFRAGYRIWTGSWNYEGYLLTPGTVFLVDGVFDVQLLRNLRSLDQLILAGFWFDRLLAESICELTSLTRLCLDKNQIGSEGAIALSQLTNLRSLGLSRNEIGDEGAAALSQLNKLTFLDVSYNQIAAEGAIALGHLANLRSLNLSRNEIGTEGAVALGQLKYLTVLHLWGNQIGSKGAVALGQLKYLTDLDLSANQIGAEGASALAQLINLTSLDLGNNQIDAEGAVALGQLTNLTSLDLGSNQIDAEGAVALGQLTNLTSLDLGSNQIGDGGAAALGQLTNLTSLDLVRSQIGDAGAIALGQLKHLTDLDLSGNHIGAEGASALGQLTNLTSLDLGNNRIGDEGASALGQLTNLTSLDLGSNQIDAKGAAVLGQLTNLKYITLKNNRIGAQGTAALGQLINLAFLDISNNQVGDEGVAALGQLNNIISINLNDNNISDDGFDIFLHQYRSNKFPHLRKISVYDNELIHRVDRSVLGTEIPNLIADARFEGLPIYEARVMVVGMGEVGKTCLVTRCFREKISPKLHGLRSDPTIAFDLLASKDCWFKPEFISNTQEETKIIPQVWDFAGQVITHGVHETFLDDDGRTIFLLVLSAGRVPGRQLVNWEDHGNGFTYWLKSIVHFGGGQAPIIVAITQCDKFKTNRLIDIPLPLSDGELSNPNSAKRMRTHGNTERDDRQKFVISPETIPEIDDARRTEHRELLNQAFGVNIAAIVDHCSACEIDLQGEPPIDRAIEPLQRAIESALLERPAIWERRFPASFPALRYKVAVALKDKAFVPMSRYQDWCEELGIAAEVRFSLLTVLHSLGTAFRFGLSADDESFRHSHRQEFLRQFPVGRRRYVQRSPHAILRGNVFHPHWLKQIAYNVVRASEHHPLLTRSEIVREVHDANRLILKRDEDSVPTEEYIASAVEFLKWTELCFEDDDGQLLFPRGFTTQLPEWPTPCPMATLRWDFIPEAAFHRLFVRLLEEGLIERQGENPHDSHAPLKLYRFAAMVGFETARACVVAKPEEGKITIWFDERTATSVWKSLYDHIAVHMKSILGEPPLERIELPWETLGKPAVQLGNATASTPLRPMYPTLDLTRLKKKVHEQEEDEERAKWMRKVFVDLVVPLIEVSSAIESLYSLSAEIDDQDQRFYFRVAVFQKLLRARKSKLNKTAKKYAAWKHLRKFLESARSEMRVLLAANGSDLDDKSESPYDLNLRADVIVHEPRIVECLFGQFSLDEEWDTTYRNACDALNAHAEVFTLIWEKLPKEWIVPK